MRDLSFIAETFRYDAESGVVSDRNGRIGFITSIGYRRFGGGQVEAQAHQIAWFLHYGQWPAWGVDHINGDKLDNRIVNLRLANQRQNMGNVGRYRTNTSGFKGVSFRRDTRKWMASIMECGKSRNLGSFPTPEEAHKAYCAAARRIFGDFARFA